EAWWTVYGDVQLNALIEEALSGSPDMAAATARLQRAQAMTQVSSSALKSQVNANASVTEDKLSYNHLTPPAFTPTGMNDYGRVTLNIQWELDFWGKNRAALSAATSELEARRAELAQTRWILSSGVATAYANLSLLLANRDTEAKLVDIRRTTATLMVERLTNGLETRGGLREADARRAAAEGALLALDEQIALLRNRLAALLGAGPDRGLSIAVPTLKLDHAFGLPPELAVNLLGRRPDVVAARLMVQAQDSRMEQKKAEFYPNINLSAFVGVQSLGLDKLTASGSEIASVGPAISLPIFTAGRLQGELRGAQAVHAELVANYHATLAHALQVVADSAVSQKVLTQRLLKAQEALEATAEAQRVVHNRQAAGLANRLDVLAADEALLGSQNAQTQLHAQSFTQDIALQRALGGGYQVAHN
ncbi:efflux transporter outer membrane subunit, partial [Rhodoferax sp.]|uniref:efflux transporter outer membrane subunit n=1 Tax=Rhodoferax sp. TaxID=50421 RepID=UPI002728FA57